MKYIKKWLIVFIAFLLLIPFGLNGKVQFNTQAVEKMFTIRVDIQNPSQIEEIRSSGIKIIAEYPSYIYGKATTSQFGDLIEKKFFVVSLPDTASVNINGMKIYPKGDDSKTFVLNDAPVGFRQSDILPKDYHYYLVKLIAPAKNPWIDQLRIKGADILEFIHNDSYVLKCSQTQIEEIKSFPYVEAVTEYLPSFKMYSGYTVDDGYMFVYATLWKGVTPDTIREDVFNVARGYILSNIPCPDFSIATILLPIVNVKDLARIPDIEYIEPPPNKIELKLNVARNIVGIGFVDKMGGFLGLPYNFDGSGQVVAVMDSGLDNGNVNSIDTAFRGRIRKAYNYSAAPAVKSATYTYGGVSEASVYNPYVPPMKDNFWFGFDYNATRIVYPLSATGWNDMWGHGTHVTGIIAGNGAPYKGIAPGATIVVQRITSPWRLEDSTRPANMTNPPIGQDYPWPLKWPAKFHTQVTTPTLWDLVAPAQAGYPGEPISEAPAAYGWTNEIPYKWDLSPGSGIGMREDSTYHDVPVVSGEVNGPRIHPIPVNLADQYYFRPEGGSSVSLAPYYEGIAGTVNYAMNDAYVLDGARVMNNSWWFYFIRALTDYRPDPGSPIFNTHDYNAISRIVDNFQYYNQDFLTVWAAGDNGRDRNTDGIADEGIDANRDGFFGSPRNDENQQFFAPAALKNGITVGAVENYRPYDATSLQTGINLFYGATSNTASRPRANFGLFGNRSGTADLTTPNIVPDADLPNWGAVIANDRIADGNEPLDPAILNAYPPTEANRKIIERGYPDSVETRKTIQTAQGKFAMAAISTRGPTSDGRIKPDLVAPGTMIISNLTQNYSVNANNTQRRMQSQYPFEKNYRSNNPSGTPLNLPPTTYAYMSGTSCSAAFVSGAALIARQYYVRFKSLTVSPMPTAALIKATLIHGATNMAKFGYPNQYDQIMDGSRIDEGWNDVQKIADNSQGWGRLNVFRSLFPLAPLVQKFDDNVIGVDADVATYKVNIDNTDVPFDVTLCWTDESAAPNTWPVLKHNLDLVVVDPNGLVYRGNQFGTPPAQDPNISVPMATSTDTLNNVERIIIPQPKVKGEYKISVIPSSLPKAPGGPVKYAIIYSGGFTDMPLEQPIPLMNPYTLAILAFLLLFAGIIGIRKGFQVYSKS